MERIGILLIHGIGDQAPQEHLHTFLDRFVDELRRVVDKNNIGVDVPGASQINILVKDDGSGKGIKTKFEMYEL